MWMQACLDVYLYFPLVAKGFVSDKKKRASKTSVLYKLEKPKYKLQEIFNSFIKQHKTVKWNMS